MINYSHAKYTDYKEIQNFIKEYWASDHILSHDREVFDHFFININKLQFFLAKDSKGNIVGILGYITNSQFDLTIKQEIAWLSMWMAKIGLHEPVGIKLLKFLEDNLNVDFVASLGVGDQVIPLYQRMGYETGSMTHLMKEVSTKPKGIDSGYLISQDFLGENKSRGISEKSHLYLKQKYLSRNFYDYSIFYIYENNFYIASIIGRILYDPTSRKSIFRVVDFAGDSKGLSVFAKNASSNIFFKNIEYIDILLSEILFIEDGVFETCSSQKYLPLYFEPFIGDYRKKNFCFKRFDESKDRNLLIVTGDCDQERPNKRDNTL
jgi:hypothetical protein